MPDQGALQTPRRITAVTERAGRCRVQVELGAALAVERPECAPVGRIGVDEEQPDATVRTPVASPARGGERRADDEHVSAVAGQNRVLAAGDGPRITLALSMAGDAGCHAAHPGLLMCQCEQRLTFRHFVEQLSLLIVAEF